jgi:hypothetical protein
MRNATTVYLNSAVFEITPWAKMLNSKRVSILEWVLAFLCPRDDSGIVA